MKLSIFQLCCQRLSKLRFQYFVVTGVVALLKTPMPQGVP